MNRSNYVTEKIQVLLTSDDIQSLNSIICKEALDKKEKPKSLSAFIRDVLRERIREHHGIQKSFVQETIDKIIEDNINKE